MSWFAVHGWAAPHLDTAGPYPMIGTPEWQALPDNDRRKWAAALDAAQHWALRLETNQEARAEASKSIAAAVDWPQVAREMQQLHEFRAANPWATRVVG
ncbi:DUF2742 domain-containing protein [Mycolicibacterium porcinum]|nr:DUF2742 domain-containing protein [Mycolicibacterium porcinum]